MAKFFIFFLFYLLFNISLYGQIFTGKIISVPDGDTVILLTNNKKRIKVRLDGIDCPERGQDYGLKATEFTRQLCEGKKIAVDQKGIDQYNRILGVVWAHGINVNEELLKQGLAWVYKHNKNKRYKQLEEKARKEKKNIWSMRRPVTPWEFRYGNRQ